MSLATQKHGKSNIVIGAGEFYLVELDASDKPIGERYLGDSIGGSLTITPEEATVFSGDGEVAETLARITTQITRTLSLTLHDISPANLALFIMGEESTQNDVATAITDEVITIGKKGRWYPLGVSDKKPAGVGAVSATGFGFDWGETEGKASTAAVSADFTLDAARGRFYIEPNGAVAENSVLKVDYTPVAATVVQAVTGDIRQLRGGIRYIETAAFGKGNNYYAPLCAITPSGEAAFKAAGRSAEQQIQLAAEILEPASGPALVINGQAG